MNETQQAHADLAFMKALVQEAGRSQTATGTVFLAAGLLYGIQCLVHWTQLAGITRLSERATMIFVIGITAAFLSVLGGVLWSDRRAVRGALGTRALNAAFGGAGVGNLVLGGSFGLVAAREHSMTVWLLYPVALAVAQGAAWYVAFVIRRRGWLALVSAGWYATAAGLALLTDSAEYTLVLGVALLVLMALPGAAMMRSAKKAG